MLHAFIDEAGSPGARGADEGYFLLSAVVVKEDLLPQIDKRVGDLLVELSSIRKKRGAPPLEEIHFKKLWDEEKTRVSRRVGSWEEFAAVTVVTAYPEFPNYTPRSSYPSYREYTNSLGILLERLSHIGRRYDTTVSVTCARWSHTTKSQFEGIWNELKTSWNTGERTLFSTQVKGSIDWDHIGPHSMVAAQASRPIQVADVVASGTRYAFIDARKNRSRATTEYLSHLWERYYRADTRCLGWWDECTGTCVDTWGLKLLPNKLARSRYVYLLHAIAPCNNEVAALRQSGYF